MKDAGRVVMGVLAGVLAVAGTYLLVTSIRNNPLEGWGMLLRALAGHALWMGAVECGARGALRRPSRSARRVAVIVASLVLTPAAALVLLMTKESGPSWSLAALLLLVWFVATGVAGVVSLRR
jgi:threonine/homoserine efflux transporter RhtA